MSKIINNGDFIELQFTGKVRDGNVFDTNIEEEAKKLDIDIKSRPLIICMGQNMILPAIDRFLTGKEPGKEYVLELKPEDAFGKREREAVRTIPISVFHKANLNPEVGKVFTFDNYVGKVNAVSGGRVIVDFNNPIAGKEVVYHLKVKRKVESIDEKAKALVFFLFRQELELKIEEKKLILKVPKGMGHIVMMFKEKFKEILNLEVEAEEIDLETSSQEQENGKKKKEHHHEQGNTEAIEKK